jgi:hypothetical protein
MNSDDPRHTTNNFNQTNSSSNQHNVGKDGKYNTIRSCGENMYQTHSQGSKSSTLDQTKQTNKTNKKKEELQPPPWCASVKKDTKNKLYSKVKHKLEDVSIVLGFNTARGDQDENLQINNGSKYKKSKTRQLTLDEPERLNKAVEKIVNSKQASMTPKNNRNSKRTSTSKRASRTAEFRKSVDMANKGGTSGKKNFVNAFNTN